MGTDLPHRTATAGSEVVAIVESTFTALRAERDEAVGLLREVVTAHAWQAVTGLPPALVERVNRLIGT